MNYELFESVYKISGTTFPPTGATTAVRDALPDGPHAALRRRKLYGVAGRDGQHLLVPARRAQPVPVGLAPGRRGGRRARGRRPSPPVLARPDACTAGPCSPAWSLDGFTYYLFGEGNGVDDAQAAAQTAIEFSATHTRRHPRGRRAPPPPSPSTSSRRCRRATTPASRSRTAA